MPGGTIILVSGATAMAMGETDLAEASDVAIRACPLSDGGIDCDPVAGWGTCSPIDSALGGVGGVGWAHAHMPSSIKSKIDANIFFILLT